MVVKRTADRGDSWHDFEHQLLNVQYSLLDSGMDASGGFQRFDNYIQVEPAGGLHRGEVAELVAVETQHFSVQIDDAQDGNFGTRPGWATFEFQASSQGFTFQTINDDQPDNTVVDVELSNDGEDTFWFDKAFCSHPFTDTANGISDNGDSFVHNRLRHYRRDFGMGPLFFENDHIEDHASVSSERIDTDTVTGRAEYRLVWNVMEANDIDSRYLPSRLL